jgi:hypothetical protein
MNQLVLYSAAPATVADDPMTVNAALELEDILEEIEAYEGSISEYESNIGPLTQKLKHDFRSELDDLAKLQSEVAELTEELLAATDDDEEDFEEDDEEDEDEEVNTDYQSACAEAAESAIAEDGSVIKTCKKLYRAIAKKCHPDKTKIPRLRNIFIQAHQAMQSYDLDTLQKLHDDVYGASGKKHSLMDRLMAARLKRDALRLQWGAIISTDDYKLYTSAKLHGYAVAKRAYRNILALTKSFLKEQLSSLSNSVSAVRYANEMAEKYGFSKEFGEDTCDEVDFDEDE